MNTPSRKPEALASSPPSAVKTCLTDFMLSAGWRQRQDTTSQMTFAKRGDPTLGIMAAYGHIVTYSLVSAPGGSTKVITDLMMVLNIDTAMEKPFDQKPQSQVSELVNQAVTRCR